MKIKFKGAEDVTAVLKANDDTSELYADEIIKAFFKLYNKLGFVNELTVIVHGSYGGDKVLRHKHYEEK